MDRTKLVLACLLDHYLACYDGNRDALALEAETIVPDWMRLMEEWHPLKETEQNEQQGHN